jgi:flagellar motility protein MotE (MotC chaperone)
MMRFIREFRLIPVVLLASISLFGLKVLGIMLDGGFTLADLDFGSGASVEANRADAGSAGFAGGETPAQRARTSWAHDMFNFPDVTGSIDSEKRNADKAAADNGAPALKPAEVKPVEVKPPDVKPADSKPALANPADSKSPDPKGGGTVIQLEPGVASPAERAILERLGERRQELDTRARELEIRENLVKSAEQRLDGRVNEVKGLEAQLNGGTKEQKDAVRLKSLVTMYENMRAKDAAKIFDRLEMPVLIAVVSQIKPRVMADIMAQMQPEVAQRLTVELASKAMGVAPPAPAAELPKIEGQPR